MRRFSVCMAGAVCLLMGCASQKEFDFLRQQNLEYLSRIDQLNLESRQQSRTIDEYRGALASAATLIKELQQQVQDAEDGQRVSDQKLSELSRHWASDQQRIAAYEAQLSHARGSLNAVRERLAGSTANAVPASQPADTAQEGSPSHE